MTHHHHAPPPDPTPLDPEERALAARLARLGPHGEPSPPLDARVLAAAHAAATTQAARRAREHGWRRVRWPVGAGVAASVVLAAGIAWQMRPLPAPQLPAGASARADAAMAPAPDSAHAAAALREAPPLARVVSALPPQETASAAAREATAAKATQATPGDVAAARALAPPPASPQEPSIVFDAPNPADAAAPVDAAVPPPAPPAPPPPVAQDAPEGEVPPATAASPAVRDAWLARIRELGAAGRTDEARASLAEFHRRYPAFAIPADLRPLLPAPTPALPAAPTPTPTTTPPSR